LFSSTCTLCQGRRERGGQWCPAPHLKSVTPISRWAPRLLHTSNTVVFKCAPPAAKSWRRACVVFKPLWHFCFCNVNYLFVLIQTRVDHEAGLGSGRNLLFFTVDEGPAVEILNLKQSWSRSKHLIFSTVG